MVNNQSSGDKNLVVIVTNTGKLSILDSIAIVDLTSEQMLHMVSISKDMAAGSYSFTLQKGKSASFGYYRFARIHSKPNSC